MNKGPHKLKPYRVLFLPTENYIARQVQTWTKQYRASETSTIPSMERLIEWLPHHVPKQQRATVVHGDFRSAHLWEKTRPGRVSLGSLAAVSWAQLTGEDYSHHKGLGRSCFLASLTFFLQFGACPGQQEAIQFLPRHSRLLQL